MNPAHLLFPLLAAAPLAAAPPVIETCWPTAPQPLPAKALARLAQNEPPLTRSRATVEMGAYGSFFSYICGDCDKPHSFNALLAFSFTLDAEFSIRGLVSMDEATGARVIRGEDGIIRSVATPQVIGFLREEKGRITCDVYSPSDTDPGPDGERIPVPGALPLRSREFTEITPAGSRGSRTFQMIEWNPARSDAPGTILMTLSVGGRSAADTIGH